MNFTASIRTPISQQEPVGILCTSPTPRYPSFFDELRPFLLHWSITAISLWAASHIFKGVRFADTSSLVVSALLLGLANAVVKPLLIVLTLPLTLVTFGLFLLVINALMIMMVSGLVKGFRVSSFWTAFFASIFVSILSIVIEAVLPDGGSVRKIEMPHSGLWL
jgi:putative membrane protein